MWKPISSAPRDGRMLTVRFRGGAAYTVRWSSGRWELISYFGSDRPTEWLDDDV